MHKGVQIIDQLPELCLTQCYSLHWQDILNMRADSLALIWVPCVGFCP